jgi:hypothetical protein
MATPLRLIFTQFQDLRKLICYLEETVLREEILDDGEVEISDNQHLRMPKVHFSKELRYNLHGAFDCLLTPKPIRCKLVVRYRYTLLLLLWLYGPFLGLGRFFSF